MIRRQIYPISTHFKSNSSECLALKLYNTTYKLVGSSLCGFCKKYTNTFVVANANGNNSLFQVASIHTTGDGIGELLADDGDFSFSSGNSTELILIGFAVSSLLLCTGLDGAINIINSFVNFRSLNARV